MRVKMRIGSDDYDITWNGSRFTVSGDGPSLDALDLSLRVAWLNHDEYTPSPSLWAANFLAKEYDGEVDEPDPQEMPKGAVP